MCHIFVLEFESSFCPIPHKHPFHVAKTNIHILVFSVSVHTNCNSKTASVKLSAAEKHKKETKQYRGCGRNIKSLILFLVNHLK